MTALAFLFQRAAPPLPLPLEAACEHPREKKQGANPVNLWILTVEGRSVARTLPKEFLRSMALGLESTVLEGTALDFGSSVIGVDGEAAFLRHQTLSECDKIDFHVSGGHQNMASGRTSHLCSFSLHSCHVMSGPVYFHVSGHVT